MLMFASVFCPVTTLAPGAATTCTGSYTLVQADLDAGRVVNAAHAEGTPPATPSNPNPPRVPSPEDEEITPLQATPALTIVKTAGTPSGNTVGSTIAYSFLVTNTGNVTVTGVAVVDDKLAQAALCPTTTLAPGGTTTCTGTYTLVQADLDAGRVVNVAHAVLPCPWDLRHEAQRREARHVDAVRDRQRARRRRAIGQLPLPVGLVQRDDVIGGLVTAAP